MIFLILIAGFAIGYVWSRVWRPGRPDRPSIAALVVGYLLGRNQNDRFPR